MGSWRPRIARTKEGQLVFVHARYASGTRYERRGMIIAAKPLIEATTVEQMQNFAEDLVMACEEPIISDAEYEVERKEEDEDEDED